MSLNTSILEQKAKGKPFELPIRLLHVDSVKHLIVMRYNWCGRTLKWKSISPTSRRLLAHLKKYCLRVRAILPRFFIYMYTVYKQTPWQTLHQLCIWRNGEMSTRSPCVWLLFTLRVCTNSLEREEWCQSDVRCSSHWIPQRLLFTFPSITTQA